MRAKTFALATLLLAGSSLGGFVAMRTSPAIAQAQPQTAITVPGATMPGFADMVARVRPAVVTITSTEMRHNAAARPDQPMGRYFGQPGEERAQPAQSLGSGFIVDAAGHIVTNNHVI